MAMVSGDVATTVLRAVRALRFWWTALFVPRVVRALRTLF
jgi:hypothetical protein